MGPFGMPMLPGNGSSGGGGTTFGGKSISQIGTPWVFDGPDSNSAVDVMTGLRWVDSGNKLVASIETSGSNNSYGIYEFDTTTAYSVQPADISYNNVNFLTYNEIADADFSPLSIEFNGDGSVGYFGEDNEIFGFSMSTNYDISTATGTGHTKTSIPNAGPPYGYGSKRDLRFNSDGTKMFVIESSGSNCVILEFSLSSAYDVTTRAGSATATFDPTTAGNGASTIGSIIFNSDGTKMYALGGGGLGGVKLLFEYDLSTGFDLTTMSYNNENLNLETLAGIDLATAIAFNDDFSKIYIADGNDGLFEFQWGTGSGGGGDPSDINNTTLVGNAPAGLFSSIGSAHTSSKWSTFGSNGTKFYVYGGTNEIASYSLSTAYDITSASIDTNAMNPTLFLNPDGVIFNPAGDKIIFFEVSGNPSIKQYDLNTPWNHTSIASTTPSATISNDPSYVQWDRGIFADSGSKFYAMQANSGGKIVEFTCSTPGDLATASAVGSSNELVWGTAQGNGESRGLAMNAAGTKLYVGFDLTGDANEQIFQYDLSTAFDLSTATYNNKVLSNLRNDNFAEIRGFYLVNDTDLYIQGLVNPSGGQGMWKYAIPASGSGGGSNAVTNGWTVRSTFSGMSNERFYSIDNDTSGNLYASGYDAVDDTILISSYDKDGAYRWSYKAGGTSDRLYGIGVDDPGNVIAVGYSISHTSGGTPFPGIVVKYASDGTHQWTKTLADNSSENWIPLAVAVKKNQSLGGDIYVAGATEAQSNSGNRNPFVVKLNSNGVVQWARKYDHGGQQSQPEGIAIDSNGDLFVSGRIHEPITGGGYSSGMVMKLNGSDGTKIWDKIYDDGETINGYHNDQFQNCAVTPEDDVVTCGWTNTNYLGSYYGTILKLSGTDGSIIWDRVTVENDGTKKIAVDPQGKIYTFTDSEVLFKYSSDGTLEQEWKITATAAGDAYYLEDITIDNMDNAVITGFHYTSGSDPAQPFITKLPATIQAGTSGDFVITAQTKGDGAGGMTLNTHTSYTANTMSNVTTGTANNLTPSSVSATTTGPNTVTGVSGGGGGGGGGGGPIQGWISTITDELQGYGYPDTVIKSLAVDSSDNIYAGGDSMGNYQIVIKMADDGTVTSAASFGGSGATNNHRAIAVASDGSVFSAGEAKDIWSKKDGHMMRLTISLTKSYDDFFGEGYDDEHLDITADSSGNVFSVGQSESFAFNWSGNPKGHIVKHDSTGGQAKVLIGTNSSKSYPQGVSTDGTNPYVILKDDGVGMVIAKLNSALSSITWARSWGASNAQDRMMDIDTNSSGESAAHMWQVPDLKVAKIDSSGTDTWRKVWSKASTDHGVNDGSHILSGRAIKLLSSGSVALLASAMPWTTQANQKSFYIVIFDSTGTPTVQKEFRLNNASHYLHASYKGNAKALVELSDGTIVFAYSYYTGSNSASTGWRNGIFKIDPTDTSTAINGTHGDWDISDITDSTTSADGASWSSHTTNLDTNMSMYFKSGYQGVANGFTASNATVVEGTQHTLGGGSGGGGGGGGASATGFFTQLRNFGPGWSLSPIWPQSNAISQASDGKYYMTGYTNYNNEGAWIAQFNEDGTFSWIRKVGNKQLRFYDIEFDGNDPIVMGVDAGYGQNFPTHSPYLGYVAKFDSSGNKTWSKVFRPNSILSNSYAPGNFFTDVEKDSLGNYWCTFSYPNAQNTPVAYAEDVCGLMKFNSSGVFQGSYLLPPSGSNPRCLAQCLYIDGNDNMYLGFTTYDPTATSYPHGNISKFTINGSGVPSYAWTKSYGQNYGGAHYDVPQRIYKSSDGNLIVGGYTQQSLVSNDYYPTLMKLNDATGDFIWKKRYDKTYGESQGGTSAITSGDKIFMYGGTYNTGTSSYEFYIREVDASDGSHVAMHEVDFTGQANPSVDNLSYSWSNWSNTSPKHSFRLNKDGNIIVGFIPNGNGFDYRPSFAKLPSTMIAGTFGGGTGTYSGNLTIAVKSATPTDYTYAATDMTYASYSTINDVSSDYQMDNYNTGTANDTVSTPTVVDESGTIT